MLDTGISNMSEATAASSEFPNFASIFHEENMYHDVGCDENDVDEDRFFFHDDCDQYHTSLKLTSTATDDEHDHHLSIVNDLIRSEDGILFNSSFEEEDNNNNDDVDMNEEADQLLKILQDDDGSVSDILNEISDDDEDEEEDESHSLQHFTPATNHAIMSTFTKMKGMVQVEDVRQSPQQQQRMTPIVVTIEEDEGEQTNETSASEDHLRRRVSIESSSADSTAATAATITINDEENDEEDDESKIKELNELLIESKNQLENFMKRSAMTRLRIQQQQQHRQQQHQQQQQRIHQQLAAAFPPPMMYHHPAAFLAQNIGTSAAANTTPPYYNNVNSCNGKYNGAGAITATTATNKIRPTKATAAGATFRKSVVSPCRSTSGRKMTFRVKNSAMNKKGLYGRTYTRHNYTNNGNVVRFRRSS